MSDNDGWRTGLLDCGLFARVRNERIAGTATGRGVNSKTLSKCVTRLGMSGLDVGRNSVQDGAVILYYTKSAYRGQAWSWCTDLVRC